MTNDEIAGAGRRGCKAVRDAPEACFWHRGCARSMAPGTDRWHLFRGSQAGRLNFAWEGRVVRMLRFPVLQTEDP